MSSRLDVRNKFLIQRAVRHWHRLSRKVVAAPSPTALKARLDGALGCLIWLLATWQTDWSLKIFKVLFNLISSMKY